MPLGILVVAIRVPLLVIGGLAAAATQGGAEGRELVHRLEMIVMLPVIAVTLGGAEERELVHRLKLSEMLPVTSLGLPLLMLSLVVLGEPLLSQAVSGSVRSM